MSEIEETIVKPSVEGLKKRDILYRGVLYIGVMVTKDGPKVLEYNVRFGDPEAQLIFPLVESDWGESLYSLSKGETFKLKHSKQYACSVVLAAEGYPDAPKKGAVIEGLDEVAEHDFYHAGTKLNEDSQFIVNGGRVLNDLGFGDSLKEAIDKAYANVELIHFKGMQSRSDIGSKLT
jgi:phosphoribosylamine--glycine ligase